MDIFLNFYFALFLDRNNFESLSNAFMKRTQGRKSIIEW